MDLYLNIFHPVVKFLNLFRQELALRGTTARIKSNIKMTPMTGIRKFKYSGSCFFFFFGEFLIKRSLFGSTVQIYFSTNINFFLLILSIKGPNFRNAEQSNEYN